MATVEERLSALEAQAEAMDKRTRSMGKTLTWVRYKVVDLLMRAGLLEAVEE